MIITCALIENENESSCDDAEHVPCPDAYFDHGSFDSQIEWQRLGRATTTRHNQVTWTSDVAFVPVAVVDVDVLTNDDNDCCCTDADDGCMKLTSVRPLYSSLGVHSSIPLTPMSTQIVACFIFPFSLSFNLSLSLTLILPIYFFSLQSLRHFQYLSTDTTLALFLFGLFCFVCIYICFLFYFFSYISNPRTFY